MTSYIAIAPVVKVSIGAADGNRVARIIRAGTPVPDGVADITLTNLLDRGLIAEVDEGPTEEELANAAIAAVAADAKAAADAKPKTASAKTQPAS
jgi:hypothetical protein